MNGFVELIEKGGYVMVVLIALSCLLYENCFNLLLQLRHSNRQLRQDIKAMAADVTQVRALQAQLQDLYRVRMIHIQAMVSAAPLLGLLGTVIGMVETFESMADRSFENSVAGLSSGISKALLTTETGLAIAIPAMIILYYAQRQLKQATHRLIEREAELIGGATA